MPIIGPPIPAQDDMVVPSSTKGSSGETETEKKFMSFLRQLSWRVSDSWTKWFSAQVQTIQSAAQSIGSASESNQSASIASTGIQGASLSTGVYRLAFYLRVTQAATTSSSIQVTFSWTDDGVACSRTTTAATGNLTTTTDTGTILVLADANSPISYSTTYGSVGATPMKYKIIVTLESINV